MLYRLDDDDDEWTIIQKVSNVNHPIYVTQPELVNVNSRTKREMRQ